ncbi:MAG: helix-turn-helix domain-containing protein [Reyranella sp.]|uniref:helix-turn-helix domain-containing protein n=1 Tax=Reyranella sp. TaxID=1929291 RepID=UPI001206059B|nr:helix-turn-helix domain-containing protein [Reyranella sp.]TAJ36655.1 MAG: helix-turn-helix domain-containing protein [Reyranella sp.]
MSKQPRHFGIPGRSPAGMALEDWVRQPFSDDLLTTPPKAATEASVVASRPKLLACAPASPKRLRTPSRQRAAFLRQLERCGSAAEAATRAGINRGSVYRWRARNPAFAGRWDAAIRRYAREVGDDIVLAAHKPNVQPYYYRGKKVGERRRVNVRLMIHVQNRLDADRRRAEDRAERRELLLLQAELANANRENNQPATPAPVAAKP